MLKKTRSLVWFVLGTAIALMVMRPSGTATLGAWQQQDNVSLQKLAIVIDDFGNNMEGTAEMLALPIPLTVAVMPFMPSTKKDAEAAHQRGHQVFVHLPMEPVKGKHSWLGPGAITTDLSDAEIRKRVEAAIDDVPHAIGLNNHMGSKATADMRVMRVVLTVCRERGLMFLDSRTTPKSVIPALAQELGVPFMMNRLFFDDVYTTKHITKQMELLCKFLDKSEENYIAIGHVGPSGKKTADVLRRYLPKLRQSAELVFASQLSRKNDTVPRTLLPAGHP